ncbi:conserved hypothetical protein [metagenome]|uniref:Uncharacterized protein n=1 Tax=metagenome TaxID=256318 RepID=A0A2P2C0W5_9ZZZZ
MTIWIDATCGASGDMLLGALVGAGVPVEVLQTAIDTVTPEPVRLEPTTVSRNGFAATLCGVRIDDSVHHRSWRDIRGLLQAADLGEPVRALAIAAFERLARAEATVHGSDPLDVSFHEVGSLDAIADVVGVCAGFHWLSTRGASDGEIVVSPVAVGSGSVRSAHGPMPVPPPAVAELLRGVPSYAGLPGAPAMELCTPTGAALLTELADRWGPQPAMSVDSIGIGAGTRDPEGYANVLRVLVATESGTGGGDPTPLLIETNVDDLDPRVWPSVISTLLSAGASDAWLTPILMKKGRPAHTLSVLVRADRAPAVRSVIFRHTSSIGLRESPLAKHALDREMRTVTVQGQEIAIKLASEDGEIVNAQPEYDDVARAAAVLGRPVSEVLADAIGASRSMIAPQH